MPNYNYVNYPYGNYYQPVMPQQNYNNSNNGNVVPNMYQQQSQPQPQMPQTQTTYLPLTYVSGLIGAKSFIVAPNQTFFLRDSDEGSNLLFEKSADMYGKYTIKAYRLVETNLDDVGKPVAEMPKQDTITKNDLSGFATKNDLIDLKNVFESKMDNLSTLIQKSVRTPKNNGFVKDSDKNE